MIKKSDNKKNSEDKLENTPICRECGIMLTDENWYSTKREEYSYICKKCCCELSKKWQQNNKDGKNQSQRELNHRFINEVIDGYGGKCACCGETRREFLTIDHIDGSGREHKREIGFSGLQFYRWLRRNNYPEGFQVLCFNCNCGKSNYSVCPHDKEIFGKEFEAKHKTPSSKSIWKLRLNVIKGYGGKCELCGEDNPHFLTIDHINGGGSKETEMLGGWYKFYKKLRDENYPRDNFRLLCYNCNCALGANRITEEELIKNNVNI